MIEHLGAPAPGVETVLPRGRFRGPLRRRPRQGVESLLRAPARTLEFLLDFTDPDAVSLNPGGEAGAARALSEVGDRGSSGRPRLVRRAGAGGAPSGLRRVERSAVDEVSAPVSGRRGLRGRGPLGGRARGRGRRGSSGRLGARRRGRRAHVAGRRRRESGAEGERARGSRRKAAPRRAEDRDDGEGGAPLRARATAPSRRSISSRS